MIRTLLTLAAGIGLGTGAMNAAHHEDGEKVKVLSATDIKEKLDGKEAKATVVEVTIRLMVTSMLPEVAFEYGQIW